MMEHSEALRIAEKVVELLEPHCFRIAIAGSIRRLKPEVKDIEIVCIPKPYENEGIFVDGLATVVNQWEKVKGDLQYRICRYTQRILPEGIKLDLFFCTKDNWGIIYTIRTGPAEWNINTLIPSLRNQGYRIMEGSVHSATHTISTPQEEDIFYLMNKPFIKPEDRK